MILAMLSMNDRHRLVKSLDQNNQIKYIETLSIEFKLQLWSMLDVQNNSCNLNIYCKVIQKFTTYIKKSNFSQIFYQDKINLDNTFKPW